MRNLNLLLVIIIGIFLATTEIAAEAHGDVTPHSFDTSSLKPLGTLWIQSNPYRDSEKAASVGSVGYMHNCAGCHGLNVISGGIAPDLLKLNNDCLDLPNKSKMALCLDEVDNYFKDIVLKGTKTGDGRFTMPAYESVFTQESVWAIKTYIDLRTIEERNKKAN